jgi:methylated-DNA-[protein]-cysteine S-methyltransferase
MNPTSPAPGSASTDRRLFPSRPPVAGSGPRWWDDVPVRIGDAAVDVLLISDGDAITGVYFGPARAALGGPDAGPRWRRDPAAVGDAACQLQEYLAGRRTAFDLPLRPAGTGFQRAVWEALLDIPYGATRTYGQIAAAVDRPGSSRAVGRAVGTNPIGIVIPCHRVVGANGSLTGYGGGLPHKAALLRLEGVTAL